MGQAGLKQVPRTWTDELARQLTRGDDDLVRESVATVRRLTLPKEGLQNLSAALLEVARQADRPAEVRIDALAAIPGSQLNLEPDLFEFVRANVTPDKPVMFRGTAAGILSRSKLAGGQLLKLTETIKLAGPLELSRLIAPFEGVSDEAIGMALLSALEASPGLAGLAGDTLKARLVKFPGSVQKVGDELLATLNLDTAGQKARLDELAASLGTGDIRRGQAIFNSEKTACASCHAIGYLGGNLGPDLTRIGQIRTERDLLEAIVFPSASFVRSYEPLIVSTKEGEEYSGVLRRDSHEEVVLATGPGAEVRIARSDVAEMRPGQVSVMPGGLDEQLSSQELADLVAFLKATR
jgi:putative heme-binding domain-containing protein